MIVTRKLTEVEVLELLYGDRESVIESLFLSVSEGLVMETIKKVIEERLKN